ncbi:MAG: DinB family protein [Acidobacteriota bacterium]
MTQDHASHASVAHDQLVGDLTSIRHFFLRVSSCFTEDDSGFAPAEGMMTTAQQIAHTAQTVDWFVDGAFSPEGFGLDFESMAAETAAVTSIAAAREQLSAALERAVELLGSKTPEELAEALPAGPIMGGEPRYAVLVGLIDHTAHHRGALTVYARLCGHTPPMAYGE